MSVSISNVSYQLMANRRIQGWHLTRPTAMRGYPERLVWQPQGWPNWVRRYEDYLFTAAYPVWTADYDYDAGIIVVDASDPMRPVRETILLAGQTSPRLVTNLDVTGIYLVTLWSSGVSVYDASKTPPARLAHKVSIANPQVLTAGNGYAFVHKLPIADAQLTVYELPDVTEAGTIDLGEEAYHVTLVADDTHLVASYGLTQAAGYTSVLRAWDISEPTAPVEKGRVEHPEWLPTSSSVLHRQRLAVSDGYAWWAGAEETVGSDDAYAYCIDANLEAHAHLEYTGTASQITDIDARDGYVAVKLYGDYSPDDHRLAVQVYGIGSIDRDAYLAGTPLSPVSSGYEYADGSTKAASITLSPGILCGQPLTGGDTVGVYTDPAGVEWSVVLQGDDVVVVRQATEDTYTADMVVDNSGDYDSVDITGDGNRLSVYARAAGSETLYRFRSWDQGSTWTSAVTVT